MRNQFEMILLIVLALLHLPSTSGARMRLNSHLSDALRLKCDSLLYRTTFADDQCYFAVLREVVYNSAQEQCSAVLPGSKVGLKLFSSTFSAMMLEKSKFHLDSSSAGSKYTICIYGSEYSCDDERAHLNSGRCTIRAPKKMNYTEAENYCKDMGMEIPAPTNELDNKIVKESLSKDPAWVRKTLVRENSFNWKQDSDYSKWSTCDWPAGHNPRLYAASQMSLLTCAWDAATVIDRTGYWSNGGVQWQYLMDVVCIKNADNIFTKGEATSCNYHENHQIDASKSSCRNALPASPSIASVIGKTCYTSTRTTTRYEVLDRSTVETKRGCEVACNAKSKCVGFSLKEGGEYASCVLLSSSSSNQQFDAPTTIFLKKTTGCVARTNIFADFGEDPCIDSRHDNQMRPINSWRVCNVDKNNLYIVRAIDANGCRFTMDNDFYNWIAPYGDMWELAFGHSYGIPNIPIVAASCVLAGGDKCPCKPLQHIDSSPSKPTYPAIPEVINPCNKNGAWIWFDTKKSPTVLFMIQGWLDQWDTARSFVTCKAGMWHVWKESNQQFWGVSGLACWG